jgi:hypothetical protein
MSYVAEVRTGNDPKWYRNALVFATSAEARAYGEDLMYRWTAVVEMRVTETDDAATHGWKAGRALREIES